MSDGEKKRPGGCRSCFMGVLSALAFVVILVTVFYVKSSRYNPYMPPLIPMPVPNGNDNYEAAGIMLNANGGADSIYNRGNSSVNEQTDISLAGEKKVVSLNQPAIKEMHKAFGKQCRAGGRLTGMVFPKFANIRPLSLLLMADADVRMNSGDYSGAFTDGLDTMQMASDISRGGLSMHLFMRGRCESYAQHSMLKSLDHLTVSECTTYLARLQQIMLNTPPREDNLQEDRAYWLNCIKTRSMKDFYADLGFKEFPPVVSLGEIGWRILNEQTLREIERLYAETIDNNRKPSTRRRIIPHPTSPYLSFLPFEMNDFLNALDLYDARKRLLLAALAICKYKLEHNRLPDSLSQLSLPGELTTDPYNGKQIIYKPAGGDYLLYCVGPDGKDNGGSPVDENYQPSSVKGDIGLLSYNFNAGKPWKYYSQPVPHMKASILTQEEKWHLNHPGNQQRGGMMPGSGMTSRPVGNRGGPVGNK